MMPEEEGRLRDILKLLWNNHIPSEGRSNSDTMLALWTTTSYIKSLLGDDMNMEEWDEVDMAKDIINNWSAENR